jgi:hypothetical protein
MGLLPIQAKQQTQTVDKLKTQLAALVEVELKVVKNFIF